MNLTNIETYYKAFPEMHHNRNRFPFKKTINYNMKMGEITPIALIRTFPGSTFKLDMATVIKVAPLQNPPQDDAIWKGFAFSFSDRIEWDNYKYWYGEPRHPEDPENEETYLFPKVKLPENGFAYNSFYDNIGCPPEVGGYSIDKTIPNGDRDIYNNYFRNQALENPLPIDRSDADGDPNENMTLRKICKPRDIFTSCLPTATGANVEIPLGSECAVVGTGNGLGLTNGGISGTLVGGYGQDGVRYSQYFARGQYGPVGSTASDLPASANGITIGVDTNPEKSGLKALLSTAVGAPLEGLYQAIAYNTYEYIRSRGGSRYFEELSNVYGIVNPEGVMQIPEFLGSLSQYIDFDTVTQTSESGTTPLANRAANGYMENYGQLIDKSFGEFGWIIIYGVVTHYPKYQQGVSKLMQTEDKLDLFNPLFNLIGDEAIYQSDIFIQSDSVLNENGEPVNNKVLGYNKRHSRYIMPIDEIHGEQRSSYSQSLDTNHFAEYYTQAPVLNKTFDKVNDTSFKRNLQVTDETQFICNSLITGTLDCEIPRQSVPSPFPDLSIKGV